MIAIERSFFFGGGGEGGGLRLYKRYAQPRRQNTRSRRLWKEEGSDLRERPWEGGKIRQQPSQSVFLKWIVFCRLSVKLTSRQKNPPKSIKPIIKAHEFNDLFLDGPTAAFFPTPELVSRNTAAGPCKKKQKKKRWTNAITLLYFSSYFTFLVTW